MEKKWTAPLNYWIINYCLSDLTRVETLKYVAVVNTAFFILLQWVRPGIAFNFKVILKRKHSFLLNMNHIFADKTQADKTQVDETQVGQLD